jgi:Icc-related predicted phosphoesterase
MKNCGSSLPATMPMLFTADLHYALKQFDWLVANARNFDPIIIGGDLLDLNSSLDSDVQIVVVEKYLDRISAETRVLVSSGNHDGDSRNDADESVAQWISDARTKGLSVDGDSLEIAGDLITICPWWDGPSSRSELERQLERAAANVRGRWIWVHHAPPAGAKVCWTGRKSVGDEFLLEWIKRFRPDIVLSGHIHNSPFYPDGGWVDRIGPTWVFNPGREIGATPVHIVLDLEAMTAEWISTDGRSLQRLVAANG